ncbi:hypothetical protein OIV83_005164 [Microbotryomycetes sp. JL201]|nr:hypothetical protein OIV83_005164 [Microbotryomycetes sp. JL201]
MPRRVSASVFAVVALLAVAARWVAGTETQALLELDFRDLSVFASNFTSSVITPGPVNDIIAEWAANRPVGQKQMAVVAGGAAADPASLGGAWTIASRTVKDAATKSSYRQIVKDEIDFQLSIQSRTFDGAISMRPNSEPVQLWSDYMSMVPPFLAYYGVVAPNQSALDQAYQQCQLYRKYLRDPTTGLWKHVVLGSWQDNGLWATGNAWAAHGMTRVLATIKNSRYGSSQASRVENLRQWTDEILAASFSKLAPSGLVPNYFDKPFTFSDPAASALLCATTFRLASLGLSQTPTNIQAAIRIRQAVLSRIDSSTGWVNGCVDPIKWNVQTDQSPESLAFILMMESAFRDFMAVA